MEALDGTRFSHSGIATRIDDGTGPATHLASALATELPDTGFDIGGVRWDEFATFWGKHRDLYCIPMTDELRARALAYLTQFEPEPDKEGSFSFLKLVTVAAGLRSVELEPRWPDLAERLFGAARDVAQAWEATKDDPSYYCAELAAHAYGRPFTRAEMVPAATGLGNGLQEWSWIGRLVRAWGERVDDGGDPTRAETWAALFSLVFSEDWDFVSRAVGASTRSSFYLLGGVRGSVVTPLPLADPPADHPGLAHTGVEIPAALVTPRMLWAAFGRDAIRRVEKS
ncbi:hypothetical protein [Actinomycetospora succinea]|nr:hypothetical protein [Actinomycetospora succinea]